jgi:hypothetical protein
MSPKGLSFLLYCRAYTTFLVLDELEDIKDYALVMVKRVFLTEAKNAIIRAARPSLCKKIDDFCVRKF